MKTYIKTIILIFSMVVSCLFVASLITYECATTVNAQTVSTGQTEINIDVKNAPVATSGDAGYMSTVRTVTDVYNVCVLMTEDTIAKGEGFKDCTDDDRDIFTDQLSFTV